LFVRFFFCFGGTDIPGRKPRRHRIEAAAQRAHPKQPSDVPSLTSHDLPVPPGCLTVRGITETNECPARNGEMYHNADFQNRPI
jgi:hypothetical protein